MNEKNSRSKDLLNKVYDHLDSIDVSKLSMNELKDFLEVVQKGQFLESFGPAASFGFGGWGGSHYSAPGGIINCGTTVEQGDAGDAAAEK